jgi:hypothetical protein
VEHEFDFYYGRRMSRQGMEKRWVDCVRSDPTKIIGALGWCDVVLMRLELGGEVKDEISA